MEEPNITEETIPEEVEETPTDGAEAVGEVVEEPTVSLKALNEKLGKDFKDVDTALKSVKDTYSYVGKKVEDVKQDVKQEVTKEVTPDPDSFVSRDEYNRDMFYKDNPELAPYKHILGDKPEEALKDEKTKETLDKLSAYDKAVNSKSVIHSNARTVDQNSDYNKDFEQAQKTGDWSSFLSKHKGIK